MAPYLRKRNLPDMAVSPPPKPPGRKPHEPVAPESGASGRDGARPAGRIEHDDRGNAVWKWGDTNRSDSTSRVLRRLEVPDLKIEGQDEPAQLPGKAQAPLGGPTKSGRDAPKSPGRVPMVDAGGGYNPYNLTVPVKKQTAAAKPIPPKGSGRR